MNYYPDDYESARFEEELMPGCDYGLSEFCEDPFARDTGCTVNCRLYLESLKTIEEAEG